MASSAKTNAAGKSRGRPVGRPSTYTPGLARRICDHIAGGRSLRSICEAKSMPHAGTVHRWLAEDRGGFRERYARACQQRAEHYAEEIIEIADSDDDPNSRRVRVDARKWVVSKLLPRKYGDRVDITSGGEKMADPVATLGRIADQLRGLVGDPDQING